jgi:hypothetical protein
MHGTALSTTHPAGAITRLADGTLRQHGDPNPELNSAPSESADLRAGDVDASVLEELDGHVTQPATDVAAERPDIGTE